jgi:hypothetical protein
MKMYKKNGIKLILLLTGLMAFTSCEYKEIADADFPDSKLYLPAAVTGIYEIADLTKENLATPTPGSTYRYVINKEENTFEIPLSVFRSGLNRSETVSVTITANADTIQSLINDSILKETLIIPPNAYSFNETIVMAGGSSVAPFNLNLDLGYIQSQIVEDRKKKEEDKKREEEAKAINPDTVYVSTYFSTKYAVGITISTAGPVAVNPNLNTVIVSLDIRIFSPETYFQYVVDEANSKQISFLNRSEFGIAYLWNFGDGKTSSEINPKHIYAEEGVYTVTLKTTGLLEDEVAYTETIEIKTQ